MHDSVDSTAKNAEIAKPVLRGPDSAPFAVRWRSVLSERNSRSTARLKDLDWSTWWSGGGYLIAGVYLHVPHQDGESVHRVTCRHSDQARLGWKHGRLWWVYSEAGPDGGRRPDEVLCDLCGSSQDNGNNREHS